MNWIDGLIDLAKPFIAASIRHTIGAVGLVLVHDGVLQSNQTNDFVGAVMFLIAIGWSWWQKRGQEIVKQKLNTLEVMAKK
jgi:hypothetical protein